eukprot:TRINITY_DN1130_c0_g5_i1.p1 TRINITY_DN1130_c0_g5~~TRINITY_DN1130_c0_g5_i1.p1  ORF type:complete len:230 (+),score=90.20 TRINITY_DN1130_c0_g5_i1:47-691(+)
MRRIAARAAVRRFSRTLIARDGVCEDDRRWWEWHIPTRSHKGAQTTALYLDGIGRHTWKCLIERDVFTVEDVSNLTDDDIGALERAGAVHVSLAREHAQVFMQTMKERERELSLQQSSWDKEVERVLKEREELAEANRKAWEITNRVMAKERREAEDLQRQQVDAAVEAYDYGPGKLKHQKSRFEDVLGKGGPQEIDAEADEGTQSGEGGNPFK